VEMLIWPYILTSQKRTPATNDHDTPLISVAEDWISEIVTSFHTNFSGAIHVGRYVSCK